MSVKKANNTDTYNSTQRYLPFSQIRENVIIMRDNSYRMVVKCSAINFLLKSTQEQDAIIMSFQRFLNAIDFPVQIMIRSTKLDIWGYINNLENIAVNQKNPLLQNQTYEYINFLNKLIEVAQIMKKEFYVVIPFDYEEDKSVRDTSMFGPFTKFWQGINNQNEVLKIRSQIKSFTNGKKWLVQRYNTVKTSLESIGIKSTELDKEELVKFLHNYYNPSINNYNPISNNLTNYNLMN